MTKVSLESCQHQRSPLHISKSIPQKLAEGARIRDLLKEMKIAGKDVKPIFVNGKHADFETVLHPGGVVRPAPPTGGM